MSDRSSTDQPEVILRREFFWSGRTLRCDIWVSDDVLGEYLKRTEDCMGVDWARCVVAYPPYDTLIPELLNSHFEWKRRKDESNGR